MINICGLTFLREGRLPWLYYVMRVWYRNDNTNMHDVVPYFQKISCDLCDVAIQFPPIVDGCGLSADGKLLYVQHSIYLHLLTHLWSHDHCKLAERSLKRNHRSARRDEQNVRTSCLCPCLLNFLIHCI